MDNDPYVLLEARGISKAFPGVQALDDVQIMVRRGTLHALLGENGAGKSTLMNVLAGVLPPDRGEILVAGRPMDFHNPREAQEAGIAVIFQEFNLVPGLSVAENIFLGREPRNVLGLIDYRRMHADARQLLSRLDPELDVRTPVERLRVGAQQIVEIAKALSFDTRIIIMDEPTSAITEQEIESLFRLIHQLKEQGVGIIYITHKLDELPRIADELTILRDGKLVAHRLFGDVTHDEIVRLMVGRELAEHTASRELSSAEEIFAVRGLSLRHPKRPTDFVFRDVSLSVRRGEVLGLFGLMGAGRTELLQTIFGLHPQASQGEISVAGQPNVIRNPQDAIRAGIALAPEDRKCEGLVLSMTVAENTSLSCLRRATRFGLVRPALERSLVQYYVDRLAVRTPSLNQCIRYLSGGNQQKVVVSKWLATNPRVLLLDEPTRGIDIHAKREMYTLIDELARGGLAVVIVSSELPEILSLADRILVMAEGRIAAEFPGGEATEEAILKAALPKQRMAPTVSA